MKKSSLLFFLLISSFLLLSTSAHASMYDRIKENVGNRIEEKLENRGERLEKKEELKDEIKTKVCDDVTSRINQRIKKYEENHDGHVTAYNKLKNRLQELVTKLEAEGKDVTKLKADLVILEEKIKAYSDAKATFIETLKNSQSMACGESQGAFKEQIGTIQDAHRTMMGKAKDIRTFFSTVIKVDLRALK